MDVHPTPSNPTNERSPALPSSPGVVTRASTHSMSETAARLEAEARSRGLQLFAHIDHAEAARRAGLQMRETQVLLFGSPRTGTPAMVASPLLALDLPLKALVWEYAQGEVWVSNNSTDFLAARHHVPEPLMRGLAGIDALVASAL